MAYLPFYVYCDGRENCVEFEDFLHKKGWVWDSSSKYVVRDGDYIRIKFGDFDPAKKVFQGWCSLNRTPGYDKYEYPRDRQKILVGFGDKPSYTPKKFDRGIMEGRDNYLYKHIVFRINNYEEAIHAQKELFKQGFKWWNDFSQKIHDFSPYYPVCIIVDRVKKHLSTYSANDIDQYINNRLDIGYCSIIFIYKDTSFCDSIFKYGKVGPNYQPKKFDRTILESVEEYLPFYVYCDNREKSIEFEDFLHKKGWVWYSGSKYAVRDSGDYSTITFCDFNPKKKQFSGRSINKIFESKKRYLYPENIMDIRREIGDVPSYKPKKFNREIMDESKFYLFPEDLLLEKSSLSRLGVPREVMQPIQKDFAIPADAEWDRITLKRDVEKIFREGEKELVLQIEIDAIKVFVSYFTPSADKYFIDSYILEDIDWSGEYNKLSREEVSLTQLLFQINARALLYHLKSPFSLIRQPKRQLIKKEKGFEEFTIKFKEDFLRDFNSILKRIVGSKYNDARKEIQDKARQIEIENQMMISGLDDPLAGPNSLTILDEFVMQFEDAYSDFFGERLDIQELSKHFSREKIMTSFMYFIYTGRLLDK